MYGNTQIWRCQHFIVASSHCSNQYIYADLPIRLAIALLSVEIFTIVWDVNCCITGSAETCNEFECQIRSRDGSPVMAVSMIEHHDLMSEIFPHGVTLPIFKLSMKQITEYNWP